MKHHLYRLGLRLRSLPAAERARWRLDADRLGEALDDVVGGHVVGTDADDAVSGVEAVVLSTCARSELIVASDEPLHASTLREIFTRVADRSLAAVSTLALEVERDEAAVRRLFRITAGLDSPLIGEHEILGQWRRAFEGAVGIDRGSLLGPLGQRALAVGRAARRIGGLRADYARAIERWLCGRRHVVVRRVGVVGSGRFAGRLARHLNRDGRQVLRFAHHVERARQAGVGSGVELLPATALAENLDGVDLLVLAARSSDAQITPAVLTARSKPLWVVDLGVSPTIQRPRSSGFAASDTVTVATLDTLARGLADRTERSGIGRAERLVHERAEDLVRGWQVRERLAGRRLVLAAHGGGDGSPANRAVERLAEGLRRHLGRLPVETAYHLGEPGFASLAGRRDALVLPLLTSDGWYYRKLAAALGDGPTLLPPLGVDRRLIDRLVDELEERLSRERVTADEVAVLVVGHGTRRQATSGAATHRAAAAIRAAWPGALVDAAFLDQDPGLGETARQLVAERPVLAVVPFLLGHGSHATDDIDAALSGAATPTRRIDLPPLFELPKLRHVLTAIATRAMADRRDVSNSKNPNRRAA
ncbi:MAG: CbiX/SirB N-terminal domain-containing protein [Acidobacteriota bacterium]